MKTRRISKKIEEEILSRETLTDSQKTFIKGLLFFQKKYPQLSQKQWEIFMNIYEETNGKRSN